jgi:ribosomal protein S18 acetylase RimI-like enzyme
VIKKVTQEDDFDRLAQVLNHSFLTVAYEFGLTEENCPTNSAFISGNTLKNQLTGEREFYRLVVQDKSIGFVAIEKSRKEADTFYIEKVAVVPEYRHLQYGKHLMDFAINRIRELGGKRISIGIIDKNFVLKKWYERQEFVETGKKDFDHLPFRVCFMEKIL